MAGKNLLCKLLLESLTISQLLSWNVEAYRPNNHTLIKLINSMNISWSAGENPTRIPTTFPKIMKHKGPEIPLLKASYLRTPLSFDARNHWEKCRPIISRIRNQFECGSCWAFAITSMLSDRICIETNGTRKVHLSADDVITCCDVCREKINRHSCSGARPYKAILHWTKEGIVTGGELHSNEGCKPYSATSAEGRHQDCAKRCTNDLYETEYSKDKIFGKLVYSVPRSEEAIKAEIFKHGPVVAVLVYHDDLNQYKSGVYRHITGRRIGMHALKLIGWNQKGRTKYWIAINSFGTDYGWNKGYIKFLRGENHLQIEQYVTAGRMLADLSSREILIHSTGQSNGGASFRLPSVLLEMMIFFSWFPLHF